jgi:hypothetical protein
MQRKFTKMVALLILYAYERGYELSFGEAWRPEVTARFYAGQGKGTVTSLHQARLAVDLNLFKKGVWLRKTGDHQFLGEFWESVGGSWGGRFKRPDGNHYSLSWKGRR